MAEKKVTDTQGKEIKDGVIDSPVLHSSLHDAQSPDPGKVRVIDAAGNEVLAWPADAKEIAAVPGTKEPDLSEKVPENATRPTVDRAIETLMPPTEEAQEAEGDKKKAATKPKKE